MKSVGRVLVILLLSAVCSNACFADDRGSALIKPDPIKSNDPEVVRSCGMAHVYMKAKDWHTAIKCLDKVIDARIALDQSLVERAQCYYELGAYKLAIADCNKCLALFPKNNAKALQLKELISQHI